MRWVALVLVVVMLAAAPASAGPVDPREDKRTEQGVRGNWIAQLITTVVVAVVTNLGTAYAYTHYQEEIDAVIERGIALTRRGAETVAQVYREERARQCELVRAEHQWMTECL